MPFINSKITGIIPSSNLNISRFFYETKLGLLLLEADEYALVFRANQSRIRVTKVTEIIPVAYTVLGWEVNDIRVTVTALTANSIQFEQYEGLSQNNAGVCQFAGGSQVAWFKDPDGNTLSITQNSD